MRGHLAGNIPQRNVNRAQRTAAKTNGLVGIVKGAEQSLPDQVTIARIGPQQQGRKDLADHRGGWSRATFPPADNTGIGCKLDEPRGAVIDPALRPTKGFAQGTAQLECFDGGDLHSAKTRSIMAQCSPAWASGTRS